MFLGGRKAAAGKRSVAPSRIRRRGRGFRRIRVAAPRRRPQDAAHAVRLDVAFRIPESKAAARRIEPQRLQFNNTEPCMNRYDPRTPRALFAFAAATLTVATLAISVLAPAGIERAAPQDDLVTSVASERCVPSDDSVVTGMDVVAVRAHHRSPLAQARDAIAGFAKS
jgi:hypothetical protein